MFKIVRGPKKLQGTKEQMKLATGYNAVDQLYFIFITDKKTGITCRINMDEEYYNNFFYMGKFTMKQTVQSDVEKILKESEETTQTGLQGKDWKNIP